MSVVEVRNIKNLNNQKKEKTAVRKKKRIETAQLYRIPRLTVCLPITMCGGTLVLF